MQKVETVNIVTWSSHTKPVPLPSGISAESDRAEPACKRRTISVSRAARGSNWPIGLRSVSHTTSLAVAVAQQRHRPAIAW